MARTVTASDLMLRVRRRAAIEEQDGSYDGSVVDDDEMLDYVSSAYAELHDLLVQRDENYYVSEALVTAPGGTADVAWPDDFYKLRGVDVAAGASGSWYPLRPLVWSERGDSDFFDVTVVPSDVDVRYEARQDGLRLHPVPTTDLDLRVTYVPCATPLTGSGQTIDGVNGYEELLVLYALRRVRTKLDLSVVEVDQEVARQERRVRSVSTGRDQGTPRVAGRPRSWWRRSW